MGDTIRKICVYSASLATLLSCGALILHDLNNRNIGFTEPVPAFRQSSTQDRKSLFNNLDNGHFDLEGRVYSTTTTPVNDEKLLQISNSEIKEQLLKRGYTENDRLVALLESLYIGDRWPMSQKRFDEYISSGKLARLFAQDHIGFLITLDLLSKYPNGVDKIDDSDLAHAISLVQNKIDGNQVMALYGRYQEGVYFIPAERRQDAEKAIINFPRLLKGNEVLNQFGQTEDKEPYVQDPNDAISTIKETIRDYLSIYQENAQEFHFSAEEAESYQEKLANFDIL